jgi:F0F1-type ATP synthase assembly protein I
LLRRGRCARSQLTESDPSNQALALGLNESGLMVEERNDPRRLKDPQDRQPWMRLAGTGVELAAAVGGFALLGYWIDRHYDSSPRGLLIGALLGLIGGFYNLIKASLSASREARKLDQESEEERKEL